MWSFPGRIPPRKLTLQWKIHYEWRRCISYSENGEFPAGHVSSQRCMCMYLIVYLSLQQSWFFTFISRWWICDSRKGENSRILWPSKVGPEPIHWHGAPYNGRKINGFHCFSGVYFTRISTYKLDFWAHLVGCLYTLPPGKVVKWWLVYFRRFFRFARLRSPGFISMPGLGAKRR